MLKTDRIIVVEGKYDAIKLANIIDAVIIKTEGFGIFKNKEKQELLKRLGKEKGLVVLTDSDSAGFLIRNFIKSIIPKEHLIHIYIPDIYGKEKRKTESSCEGKMGVEGIPDNILKELLIKSGITGDEKAPKSRKIENFDFYEDGFSGKDGSSGRRLALQEHLGLPENLTSKQLRDILNKLYSYEEYKRFAAIYGECSEKIELPDYIEKTISILESNGFEAYAVGGSIRDSLLKREPFDWDVTTSALPEQVKMVFKDYETIDTGIKHGTVTVLIFDEPVEITTYRLDGEYLDCRHPDSVSFTSSLREDLARRDFTVNAIAYNDKDGLVDPFYGRADIEKRLIKTVGKPEKRFKEDALRILRGLRFASTLGFSIHPDTSKAIKKLNKSLDFVSGERKAVELKKLIVGEYMESVLLEYRDVFQNLIPGMDINNFEKAVKCAASAPAKFEIRFPFFMSITDEKNQVYEMYRFSNREREEIEKVREGIAFDLTDGEIRYIMCKMLNLYGMDTVCNILSAKQALALNGYEDMETVINCLEMLRYIEENNICYRVKDLDITGRDLLNFGIKEGPELGETLDYLLESVMIGDIENEKDKLINHIKEERNKNDRKRN